LKPLPPPPQSCSSCVLQGLELNMASEPGIMMPSINLHLLDLPDIPPVGQLSTAVPASSAVPPSVTMRQPEQLPGPSSTGPPPTCPPIQAALPGTPQVTDVSKAIGNVATMVLPVEVTASPPSPPTIGEQSATTVPAKTPRKVVFLFTLLTLS
jgi:hypothetical protein